MAGKRSRQSGVVHDHYGNRPGHVPTVSPSPADTQDASGQIRGKGRVYEPRGAEGDHRTSGRRHHIRAATFRRRKSHRSEYCFSLNSFCRQQQSRTRNANTFTAILRSTMIDITKRI